MRQDNPWNEENLYNVFVQIVEHCKANGITEAFHAGDFFDVRKATTQTTMKFIRERIVPLLEEAGLHIYVLVGNHDCQFKDKIRPNSPREILDQYDLLHGC
ncbi:recombination endonuclease subunit [Klebsiella phage CPRSB]|nr:recombination endonuclease subunit [Klebsiella phage CPRSB]